MHRFAFLLGSFFLAATQANAELIINGQKVTGSSNVATSDYRPQNSFQSCIANLKNQAISNGVSASTYDRYTQNLAPDYSVIEKLNYQPEFSTPIWDYLSG